MGPWREGRKDTDMLARRRAAVPSGPRASLWGPGGRDVKTRTCWHGGGQRCHLGPERDQSVGPWREGRKDTDTLADKRIIYWRLSCVTRHAIIGIQ